MSSTLARNNRNRDNGFDYTLYPNEGTTTFISTIMVHESRESDYRVVLWTQENTAPVKINMIDFQSLCTCDDIGSTSCCVCFLMIKRAGTGNNLYDYPLYYECPLDYNDDKYTEAVWQLDEGQNGNDILWVRQMESNCRNHAYRDIIETNTLLKHGDRLVFVVRPKHTNIYEELQSGEVNGTFIIGDDTEVLGYGGFDQRSHLALHLVTRLFIGY